MDTEEFRRLPIGTILIFGKSDKNFYYIEAKISLNRTRVLECHFNAYIGDIHDLCYMVKAPKWIAELFKVT